MKNNKIPLSNMPNKLKKSCLAECAWELQFHNKEQKYSISELLPGLLFSNGYADYIPELEDDDSRNLKHKRLVKDNIAIILGENFIALNIHKPYPGWNKFSEIISNLIDTLIIIKIPLSVKKTSLKYVNLIENDGYKLSKKIKFTLKIGEISIRDTPILLNTVIEEEGFINRIDIISPASSINRKGKDRMTGVLVAIRTNKDLDKKDSIETVKQYLNPIHDTCKKLFFNIINKRTLESMEPVYDE